MISSCLPDSGIASNYLSTQVSAFRIAIFNHSDACECCSGRRQGRPCCGASSVERTSMITRLHVCYMQSLLCEGTHFLHCLEEPCKAPARLL